MRAELARVYVATATALHRMLALTSAPLEVVRVASEMLRAALGVYHQLAAPAAEEVRPDQPPSDQPPSDQPPSDLPPSDLPPSDLPPSSLPPSDVPPSDLPLFDLPLSDLPPSNLPRSDRRPPDLRRKARWAFSALNSSWRRPLRRRCGSREGVACIRLQFNMGG